MKLAIAVTEPLSFMSFPNSAPRRNKGKNCARKPAAPSMKTCVQIASRGCPEKAAARRAATGASRSTLQPRKARRMRNARPRSMPRRPMASHGLCQLVDVDGRASAELRAMLGQEGLGGPPPLVAQHGEKRPFAVELGGIAERNHHLARDPMDAHAGPRGALAIARIGGFAEQRDHAQLLQQHGIERDLVETIEDIARRARRAG